MSRRVRAFLLVIVAVLCIYGLSSCAFFWEVIIVPASPDSAQVSVPPGQSQQLNTASGGENTAESEETLPLSDTQPDRELSSYYGTITASIQKRASKAGTYYARTYNFFGGDVFQSGRLVTSLGQPESIPICGITLEGTGGTVRYYDGSVWHEDPLCTGTLEKGAYFISTDAQQLLIYLPTAYRQRENSVLEEIPIESKLYIRQTDTGWTLYAAVPSTQDSAYIEYMYLLSNRTLVDWEDPQSEADWADFLFTGQSRWTYDGYYYAAPANYYPTGDGCFHRLVSAYIVTKLIDAGTTYRAAREMGLAMLDVMCAQQNGAGFFPTLACSTWLLEDYGIGPGFFDTRFNTDLILTMLQAIRDLGATYLCPTVDQFAAFYLSYIQDHGISRHGWTLVPDYWHPSGCRVTHTSLNHQCAEALMLLKFFEYSGDVRCYDLALSLVRGLDEKADFWMSGEDGNLNYAWYAGINIGTDYPYLTYNDLYKLQSELHTLTGSYDDTLREIMAYKLTWMKANGITGYIGG